MGGDVTGTNAAANVVKLQGNSISATAPTSGQVLSWNSGTSSWTPATVSGSGSVTSITATAPLTGGTITTTGSIGLGTTGTAGTYGDATHFTGLTTDAYGRVTSVTVNPIPAGITSTGTQNYLSMFTDPTGTAIGNSGFYQNGSKIGLGTLLPTGTLTLTSSTDSEIAFVNQTGTPTVYGTERLEYNGVADVPRVSLLATTIRLLSDANGLGIEGAGSQEGVLGLGESSTASQVIGTEGDGYGEGTYSIGVAGNSFSAGLTAPTNSYGVYGYAQDGGTNYAVYADGDMHVNGAISKLSGSFKIDDPLDPANKYLYHSFVESPDMMNIYNGNIITDAGGIATVTMPDYFDALNKDFRYQLTVIGTFAQAIISKEIAGNTFEIKTSVPNVKVSWQITGVRQDAWANAHRIVPEVEKEPSNKGKYLAPKEFGQPASKGINSELHNRKMNKNVLSTSKNAGK
jgi:hypothetical protein